MTRPTVTQLLEEFETRESGKPCLCGGAHVVGRTLTMYKFVGDGGIYEALVRSNCDRCGVGHQISITGDEP